MGRTKGSGAGSVYKRGNKWRGQIIVNGVRLSYTAEKKKDVLDWIAKARIISNPNRTDYTVEEWFEIYFEKYLKPRVREATYLNGYRIISNHLYPTLGDTLISDLTTEMIQENLPNMFKRDEPYCSGTYRVFHARLKEGLSYAVKQNIIQTNPVIDVVVPKDRPPQKGEAFTQEEQRKIVEYCKYSNGLDRVYYFLVATGVRVGEAIALTWDDVNLEEGYVNINKTAIKGVGGTKVQNHPKTGQSIRRIYLSDNTVKFLRRLNERRDGGITELVFPNRNGNIYNVSTLRSHWMKTCAKLNIPYKSMHALRHSWATRALEGNIDIQTVSKMLGHKSIATTIDIYQSVFSDRKIKAAKIMDQFL